MKKNIVHIFGSMNYGGAELRTIDVMNLLKSDFNKVYFFATSGKEGKLASSLKEQGYFIESFNIYDFRFPYKFIRFLKNNSIDIVHSHISSVSGYIVLLSFFAGITRRIVHFRSARIGNNESTFFKIRTQVLLLLILMFSTDILAVNNYTMSKHYKNYNRIRKCKVIYNGINELYCDDASVIEKLKNELLLPLDEKIITHIGRFDEPKNHNKVIHVFYEYKKKVQKSKLLLIGNNDTKNGKYIRSLIKDLHLNRDVYLLGLRNDIKDILAITDTLIFPSLWEGLPGVVLEALSAGVPVLCSDIGCHEEISNSNYGIMTLNSNDSDIKWADNLVKISILGKQKEISDSFNKSPYLLNNVIKQYEKLYDIK